MNHPVRTLPGAVTVLVTGLALSSSIAACREEAPPPAAAPAPAPAGHAAEGEHEHASPHGGEVASTARGHLELAVARDGVLRLWLLDGAMASRPVEGTSATARLVTGGAEVRLEPAGDHLEGRAPAPFSGEHATVVVTATGAGGAETARFEVHFDGHGPAGPHEHEGDHPHGHEGDHPHGHEGDHPHEHPAGDGAHGPAGGVQHDHTSKHGGQVGMAADVHFEALALASGEIRLWVTDEGRRPVPLEGVTGTATLEGGAPAVARPLALSSGGDHLAARLDPLTATAAVTFDVRRPGKEPVEMTFALDPKQSPSEATAGGGQGGAAPDTAGQGVQAVDVEVTGVYTPSVVELRKGVPARLSFHRKSTSPCTEEVVIPAFGVRRRLEPLAVTAVTLTPDRAGEFPFTCGMGMLTGTLVVRE